MRRRRASPDEPEVPGPSTRPVTPRSDRGPTRQPRKQRPKRDVRPTGRGSGKRSGSAQQRWLAAGCVVTGMVTSVGVIVTVAAGLPEAALTLGSIAAAAFTAAPRMKSRQ